MWIKKVINQDDFIVVLAVVFVVGLVGWFLWQDSSDSKLVGIANPAAVVCQELGYEYKIISQGKGQEGICIMPNKKSCDVWAFYAGECGTKFNYCAQQGYSTMRMTDGKDAFSPRYAVCVDKGKIVGSISGLMGLTEKLKPGCQDKVVDSIPKPLNLLEAFR